ncbi:MAG: serine hydroxymethyltransferase, partial [Oscillospiraceae bacterium]|nr:serine hydroxymethyltransferase [Oscillospiraceae bacterium]
TPFVTSGVRIGTPSVTTRGMKEAEMEQIAGFINKILKEGEAAVEEVKVQVIALCDKFPLYDGCIVR